MGSIQYKAHYKYETTSFSHVNPALLSKEAAKIHQVDYTLAALIRVQISKHLAKH